MNAKLTFLFACRAMGLFAVARMISRRRLTILCYHGFELRDETSFRPKLFIRPSTFERRLDTIKRQGYRVLPLDEAVRQLYSGSLPSNALAITIDDGFHSVHGVAAPRLAQHAFPAAVYVTTYYVERSNPIFRLAVQYLFWRTKQEIVDFGDAPWATQRTYDLRSADERERAAWDCIRHGEAHCSETERVAMARELGERLQVSYDDLARSRTMHLMTPQELGELERYGVSIELHTHRHNFPVDRDIAEREIDDNRAALARAIGHNGATHFCYPSGEWDERQWAWLAGRGIASATTCVAGSNGPETPRYALRRFLDGENIHPLEFEAALSGFSEIAKRVLGR